MQVLENAVRKLKSPSHADADQTRIEPSFERRGADTAQEPIPIAPPAPRVAQAVPPPPEPRRAPLFSDLPEPEVREVHVPRRGGGSGGGGGATPDEKDNNRFGPWLMWLGAAASIALVIGVSVWTFRLGQRDAMEVPIVAALEGPARVTPDDAGGLRISHQGRAVNSVLEGGGVEDVAKVVKTAPQDDALTDEDAASGALTAMVASQAPKSRPLADDQITEPETLALRLRENNDAIEGLAPAPLTPNGEIAPVAVSKPTPADEIKAEEAEVQTSVAAVEPETMEEQTVTTPTQTATLATENPVDEKPVDYAVLGANTDKAIVESDGAADEAAQAVADAKLEPTEEAQPVEVAALGPLPPQGEGSAFAPAMLKLPNARPADLNTAMAEAVNAALQTVLSENKPTAPEPTVEEPQVDQLATIPLPSGTRMIQLGAYGSEAIARQQWDRLSSQHGDLLGSKDHFVQRIDSSGKIFYRLRVAGYESKDETRAACAALSARGLPCITVTLR